MGVSLNLWPKKEGKKVAKYWIVPRKKGGVNPELDIWLMEIEAETVPKVGDMVSEKEVPADGEWVVKAVLSEPIGNYLSATRERELLLPKIDRELDGPEIDLLRRIISEVVVQIVPFRKK